jgi:SpoVK/Ycf46/Vps4 family AAA+-type ATPase
MAIGDREVAGQLARAHRHAAGRIATLAAKAREDCMAQDPSGKNKSISFAQIRAVSRRGDASGLGALAELIPDEVGDEVLIANTTLRQELESLVTRCQLREEFPHSLGPSIQARYRPSVRTLFVGPSGTGKTLAVAWLATRLGIPLFRVDLSAVTSKYIGETEKNLSQLLARAEQNEVLLLFDEADSLFGKRTDIHEANDRFANAQTNYLLQRMESYDGIAVLTSNGRARFDDAFSRRFDAILSFPLPGPEERRDLWLAHLGPEHGVGNGQLNLLSAVAELTGGQIRNAVLRAAVDAAQENKKIQYGHLLAGVASEFRKMSRQLPNELKQAQAAAHASSQG